MLVFLNMVILRSGERHTLDLNVREQSERVNETGPKVFLTC